MIDLETLFMKHGDEFLKGDRAKLSRRLDIHAFLLLDGLVPGTRNIVSDAEHDKIYLGIDLVALAKVATEAHIIVLIRCGVMLDRDYNRLSMYT